MACGEELPVTSKRNPKQRKNAGRTAKRTRRLTVRNNPMVKRLDFSPDGSRRLQLTDEGTKWLAAYREECERRFLEVWGREMRDDDPLFPDWEGPDPATLNGEVQADTLIKGELEVVAALEKAGIDPAMIYAYQQSGVLVTESNIRLLEESDPEALDEWNEAIDRYNVLHQK